MPSRNRGAEEVQLGWKDPSLFGSEASSVTGISWLKAMYKMFEGSAVSSLHKSKTTYRAGVEETERGCKECRPGDGERMQEGGCGESLVLGSQGKCLNQPKGGSTQARLLQQAQPSGFLGPGQLEKRRAKSDQVCLEGGSRQGGIGGCGEDAGAQSQNPLGGRWQRGTETEECFGSTICKEG